MTERPLLAQERALISTVVAFVAHPETGVRYDDKVLLLRMMSLCDAIAQMPQVDRFQIEHGPVCHIYWAARDLIKVFRDKDSNHWHRKTEARFLACHLLRYFEVRSVLGVRALGLPDHVPEPPKTPVF